MLRSRVWRPGSVFTQVRARVVSDNARAVARRGCLQWLDADGLKGGASWLDKARSARWSEPGRAPETRDATSGAPGGARAGHTARGTSKGCQRYVAPNGAPLPLWREEGNEG